MERLAGEVLNPGGKAAFLGGASGPGATSWQSRSPQRDPRRRCASEVIPKLIRLFQAGQFPFDRLVKFYDFDQINRAIADSKRGVTIKPVLLMGK